LSLDLAEFEVRSIAARMLDAYAEVLAAREAAASRATAR
jgi:hypothetical protein